jgi:septal ring factor EnvC (AmiA/AmiB activator)
MMSTRLVLVALLTGAVASREGMRLNVNPIRRVVTMLQSMSKKIAEEGELEKKQFDKFMCYCQNGAGDLEKAVADAETKIPQLESSIKEASATLQQLKADVKQEKDDRAAAKEAMAKATGIREKEAAAFAKYSAEANTNLGAMSKAIAALEKGMGGSFLQTTAANVLRKVVSDMDLSDADRDEITSFLSQGQGYAPQSGEITGILKQMSDSLTADLKTATDEEGEAKANYEALMAAKTKELASLQKSIEDKTERIGQVGVDLVNFADDLDDTKKALAEDTKFLNDLQKNCATKKDEQAVRDKLRAEEQLALADTIKLLNDDDSLELFKKTLPTPSFMQVRVSSKLVQRRAREALQGHHDARLDLIAMSLQGRKVSFDKVVSMIDDMVALLGKEQVADDKKKSYCEREFDSSEDKQKAIERTIADLQTKIEDQKATVETLTEEIAALGQGIKDLDKQVAEATTARKEAHATYVEEMAANKAADELLAIAKNRLNKFYNPKLYKAAPKREMSEEERITVNMGGTLAATAAPGGIAGTGVTAFAQGAGRPGPAPEMPGEYKKKGEESNGVIGMLDLLKADLAKEMQESEVEEKNDQAQYEQLVKDSAEKRAADAKALADKQSAKSDTEADLVATHGEKKSATAEAMNNAKYIHDLHQECDWLISNFGVRKEARAGEVESLKSAKAVLAGADYSFVQTSRHNFLA